MARRSQEKNRQAVQIVHERKQKHRKGRLKDPASLMAQVKAYRETLAKKYKPLPIAWR